MTSPDSFPTDEYDLSSHEREIVVIGLWEHGDKFNAMGVALDRPVDDLIASRNVYLNALLADEKDPISACKVLMMLRETELYLAQRKLEQ